MKKVASSIKMELAQYTELASFAQFGSDLDEETKKRLEHGEILLEILKQPQYQPVPVEHQIMIIYAAVNKYLADLGVEHVKAFEKGLYDFMDTHYAQVGKAIRETGQMDEKTEELLKEGIETYKAEFKKISGIS